MNFHFTKSQVLNRGIPDDDFLTELVNWGRGAPEEIFAVNDEPGDVMSHIRPILGPWEGIIHRRAALLELMRVHAGFESSWSWNEGVDTTNQTSVSHIEGQETGAWQVSFDSTGLHHGAMLPFAKVHDIDTPQKFIPSMKSNHPLAMEYYARLVRINTAWAGPIKRGEIDPWLSRDAVKEFQDFLK